MNDPPDGDVLSLNADSLTLTAECNHVLYKPCIVININKPHLETLTRGHTLKLKRKAFRLDVARNHFCNRVVSVWNGLPEHVVTAASLTLFKKYLRTIDFSSYIKFDRNL